MFTTPDVLGQATHQRTNPAFLVMRGLGVDQNVASRRAYTAIGAARRAHRRRGDRRPGPCRLEWRESHIRVLRS